MQIILPIFPYDTKLINPSLGVYERDGIVQYLLNGLPVYSHAKDNINAFRFITSNFIHHGLCFKVEIERAFGVSEDSVSRACKKFEAEGEAGFFGRDARGGKAYKMVPSLLDRIQAKLDEGKAVNRIAREEGISESSIRYHITQGHLKKKS
jgi:hypothetical protein